MIADTAGHIAVQCAGRIPLRSTAERGFRPGWDPRHQWLGLLPFEALPHCVNPSRGWLATANNRLAGDDYAYPLFGTWISGYRAARIREMIESQIATRANDPSNGGFEMAHHRVMHQDVLSLRAIKCVPLLIKVLENIQHPQLQAAVSCLRDWNGHVEAHLVAPTLFNVFFTRWSKAVTDIYFEGETAELLAKQAEYVASRLLEADPSGWLVPGTRETGIRNVFLKTLAYLTERFGDDMTAWTWSRIHQIPLKHVLSTRGDLGQLLNHGGGPVKGDMITVCNTGSGPDWIANSGAGYRLIADLAEYGLWAVDGSSQSGNVGTEHYADQFNLWNNGEYHFIPLDSDRVDDVTVMRMVLSR
ncbi:MAG: penicillin amidase [Planctomycetaceae bacterium]|nr:penicillin amidase [Planctomycetaceae bacterium]